MKSAIINRTWWISISSDHIWSVGLSTLPIKYGKALTPFLSMYRSSAKVRIVVDAMSIALHSDIAQEFGENDYSILVHGNNTTISLLFDMSDTEYLDLYPMSLPTIIVIEIFEGLYEWLYKYENCMIPGVIPLEKTDYWACVPKYAVNPEYWNENMDKMK